MSFSNENKKLIDLGAKFDHLGMATKSFEKSQKGLLSFGYELKKEVFDPLQGVDLAYFIHSFFPSVELVYRKDGEKSLVDTYLKQGPVNIYHTCFRVPDVQGFLDQIKSSVGIRFIPVLGPKPAILFDNKLVSFYLMDGMGLIELLESED